VSGADLPVEWRPEVRELIWAALECARRSRAEGIEQVIGLVRAAEIAAMCTCWDARREHREMRRALDEMGRAAFVLIKTARAAGVGVVSGYGDQINMGEV